MDITEQEKYKALLHTQLNLLVEEYRKAAQPILDMLVALERMQPRPIYFQLDDPSVAAAIKSVNGAGD